MKKFRNLFAGLFVLGFGVLTFTSCDNNDDPAPLNAAVDVYIQGVNIGGVVKYGVCINAFSNYDIKSAKVTAPGTDGKVYQLTATTDKQVFVYTPQTADYTSDLPAKGDYSFEVTSTSDAKITGKDALGDEKLAAIAIKTATMNNLLLKTTWDKVQNSDAYVVRLYSSDKSVLLFQSATLSSDKTEYEFGASTSGWATGKSPVARTSYVVELIGVKYETGVTTDKGYNVQFITVDTKTISWE